MMLRSRRMLRFAVPLTVVWLLSACADGDREQPLSRVETIDIPVADTTTVVNINVDNPTLNIPDTFAVADGDLLSLVWNDEFDDAQLDPEVWFFESGDGSQYGNPGWGNNELQWYLPDNARLEDGKLKITAKRESVDDFGFTSARISTADRFAFKYGRIEASIKMPSGQGLWPAFWMLSQDSPYGAWAATGEIDIVEAVNLDGSGGNEIFSTIHYGGEFPANQSAETRYTPSEDVTGDFNTYALEWDEFEIRWYFNGVLFAVQNNWTSSAAPYPAPFDQPFHILLNLAVGGNFPGSPDSSTPFPATLEVDWVRVYSGEEPVVEPAEPGIIPEVGAYVSDVATMNEDLAPPGGIQNFGSGATIGDNLDDPSFNRVLQVTSGEGYGAGAHVGFAAFTGYAAGFAADYETLHFKVKGGAANLAGFEVKFFAGEGEPETSKTYDATSFTDLGNGWYQVSVPLSDFDATLATNTGFLLGPVGAQATPFSFVMTDIGFSGAGVPPVGDHGPGTASVFTETTTESAITVTSITNSIDFGGNNTVADPNSMAIAAFEGDVVLAIDYQDSGSTFGGVVLNFGGVDVTAYDTLNFTIDTSGMAGFAELTIQIEPPGAGAAGTNVLLSSYAPVSTSGNWSTYAVPLADFTATDLSAAANLGFWNPSNGNSLAFGTLYVDDVYFSTEGGGPPPVGDHGPGTASVFTETTTESAITVTSITNSIDFGGNNTVADPNSMAIAAFEGDVVLAIDYQDSGSTFGGVVLNFGGVDLTTYNTLNFTIDTSGMAGFAELTIQIEPPGAGAAGTNVPLSSYTPVSTTGNWSTYAVPLADFTATDLSAAANLGFWNPKDGSDALAFGMLYVDDVYLSTEGSSGALVPDGGFEAAGASGLQPPWFVFENGGTVSVSDVNSNGGTYSARLQADASSGVASFPILKVERLGEGSFTGGEAVTISFDAIDVDATGVGKVFVAEFFTERADPPGGATNEVLVGGYGLSGAWQTYTYNTNLGADAAGGVSLIFKADCGANPVCTMDVFIDNVSITVP